MKIILFQPPTTDLLAPTVAALQETFNAQLTLNVLTDVGASLAQVQCTPYSTYPMPQPHWLVKEQNTGEAILYSNPLHPDIKRFCSGKNILVWEHVNPFHLTRIAIQFMTPLNNIKLLIATASEVDLPYHGCFNGKIKPDFQILRTKPEKAQQPILEAIRTLG